MLIVKENFLPGSYCDEISLRLMTSDFPWFFFQNIDKDYPESQWNKFYSHLVIDKGRQNSNLSSFFSLIGYSIEEELKMKISQISLMRLYMYTSTPSDSDINKNILELSRSDSTYVALLFVNENDGDAVFIPNDRGRVKLIENNCGVFTSDFIVKPEKNKIVIFNDEYVLHDRFPEKSKCKVVFHIVFEAEPIVSEKDINDI